MADDPLDLLRQAFDGLVPPDPVAEPDRETAAVIAWLAGAFEALEVPAAAMDPAARSPRGPTLAFVRVRRAVAAAALLIACALGGRALLLHESEESRPPTGGLRPAPVLASVALDDPLEPRLVAVRADGIELRSGEVRLILLGGGSPPRP